MNFRKIMFALSVAALCSPSPVFAGKAKVTSEFGARRDPFHGNSRPHNGIDIAMPHGSPVFATADGWVSRAGWWGNYGIVVEIMHSSGHETRFAHLSSVHVTPGTTVRKGQMIGRIGSTGRSTGPHLHYEVRFQGKPLDPKRFM